MYVVCVLLYDSSKPKPVGGDRDRLSYSDRTKSVPLQSLQPVRTLQSSAALDHGQYQPPSLLLVNQDDGDEEKSIHEL